MIQSHRELEAYQLAFEAAKRRYRAAFVSRLNDAESEAAETQTWLQFSVECQYLSQQTGAELYQMYDVILGKLVGMITRPQPWILQRSTGDGE